jgi:ATP-dependent helicase/nuclease subunit A
MTEGAPTAEQLAAIRVHGSAAVRAGAGAGKTRVLSEHFLHLLRPGADGSPAVEQVSEILAITFTEKAASEMKTKIRALVAQELARSSAAERGRWERARRELLGAQISTIHAFCHRVVRENPVEARVDPAAVLLDEHESRSWLEGVVGEALTARLRAGDAAARLLVTRFGLRQSRDGGAVGLCMRLLGRLWTTGRSPEWIVEATASQADRVAAAETALRAAAGRVIARIEEELPTRSQRRGLVQLREEWPQWLAMLRTVGAGTPRTEFALLGDLVRVLRVARFSGDVADDLGLDGARFTGELPAQYGAILAREDTTGVAALLDAVARDVRARRDRDGVLTFDDLVVEAYGVLTRHPAVRERYAHRFRAILVDEFQDTDAVQAGLVRALAGASVPLFVVGDEKQSIYGFRGADVAVFQGMRDELGRDLSLGTNFRSQPAILEFVNALAAATLRRPAAAVDPDHWTVFDARQRLVPHRPQTWPRPGVRLVSFVAEQARRGDIRTAEMREIEARALGGVIQRLHEQDGIRYGGITVLFRALSQVKLYEHALRRADIPYYVVKGRGFFQCQEIRDLLSLLACIANRDDALALAAVLRSPFFAFDDDTLARLAWAPGRTRPRLAGRFRARETFADITEHQAALGRARDLIERLRRLASRATIAELLEEALAATDFEAVCLTQFQGTQKVANVRKLIELARDAERRRRFGLRQFVAWGRDLEAREPREPEATLVGEQDDVVRLMTIHQAKGLEFDVVVLPDLGRRLERETAAVVLDDTLGVLLQADDGALHNLPHAWLKEHRDREQDRSRAEHARLLYVACTRAKDHLVLLEGKGDTRFLEGGRADPHVWTHQIWELLGRDRIHAASLAAEPRTALDLPGGGEVLVERAELYLGAGPGRVPEVPEPVEAEPTAGDLAAVARVLGFRPPPAPELATSPTALADFRRCPRQYWYRHVLGLPENFGRSGARWTLLGTAAHAVMEHLDLSDPEADVARRLAASPEALLLRESESAALAGDLRVAARTLADERAAGLEVVGREVPFVLPLPRGEARLFLHGRLDVLARRGRRWVVRDFKYAKPNDAAAAQYGAQLGAYQLAVRALGADEVDAELVFLRGGTTVRPLPAIDATIEEETLVQSGALLARALAENTPEAFGKKPEARSVCEALGCGYVGRCWGRAVTRRAVDPRTDTFAS